MTQATAAAEAVFRELRPQFDGKLPASLVRDYIIQATTDLQGSICREALPEMVSRLAAGRLERHILPDQPADEVRRAQATGLIYV